MIEAIERSAVDNVQAMSEDDEYSDSDDGFSDTDEDENVVHSGF